MPPKALSTARIPVPVGEMPTPEASFVPRCVKRTGKECRDCVECLGKLPKGKVCGDCAHIVRCKALGYTDNPDNPFCSFIPSRYSGGPHV